MQSTFPGRIRARAFCVAAVCGVLDSTALAGPFQELAGLSSGWITGDAVGATLTKTLSAGEAGERRREAWLHVGCRANAPPLPVSFWLGVAPPPGAPEVPHWASEPFRFAATLWRRGEFDRVAVVVRIGTWSGNGTLTRALVASWTEPNPPPLDVEVEKPEAAGWALLESAARGDGKTGIDIRGRGVRLMLAARWNADDRRFARAMRRNCPRP